MIEPKCEFRHNDSHFDGAALAKVRARVVVDQNGCWLWQKGKDRLGYGRYSLTGYPRGGAYRVAYIARYGPVAPGLHLDHLCRVPACCNPDHLEPVTCRENILRGNHISYRRRASKVCTFGHEYTSESTYVHTSKSGVVRRICRICNARRDKNRASKRVKKPQEMRALD